jgi:hypothetical protein
MAGWREFNHRDHGTHGAVVVRNKLRRIFIRNGFFLFNTNNPSFELVTMTRPRFSLLFLAAENAETSRLSHEAMNNTKSQNIAERILFVM